LLRRIFARWGLPRAVRVDNGHPWGLNRGLPPALSLWLIGLGVAVEWIDPGQPRQNPRVERSNGVMQQWAEPARCTTRSQLQSRLHKECEMQRERYPSVAGMPRSAAYPGLGHSGRPYRAADERRTWELARVDRFLGGLTLYRRANARGTIWIYGDPRNLGRAQAGKEVHARFDPSDRRWAITDLGGCELKRLAAPELSRARIMALDVGKTHSKRQM
jgi:hypothetical protein